MTEECLEVQKEVKEVQKSSAIFVAEQYERIVVKVNSNFILNKVRGRC